MPIGGGYCVPSSAQHTPALSLSSFELNSNTTRSLKESLLALKPISGTVSPSRWTTTSPAVATSSSHNADKHQSSNVKQLVVARSETFTEPASFSVLPENVLECIFSKVSSYSQPARLHGLMTDIMAASTQKRSASAYTSQQEDIFTAFEGPVRDGQY